MKYSRIRLPLTLTLLATVCVAGCAKTAGKTGMPYESDKPEANTPDKVEIYAIDYRTRGEDKSSGFQSYKIMGSTEVTEAAGKDEIVGALKAALGNDTQMKCFEPRHGLRIVRGDERTDYVICFTCNNYYSYLNDKSQDKYSMPIKPTLAAVLNKHLEAAGIELAD